MPVSRKKYHCHAVGRRRPLERNNSMAVNGWADADERVAAQHSWDHGTDVEKRR
jgi:hypothetical protein